LDAYTLEVDLLCFSLGGVEHPSARESTILVKTILRGYRTTWEMTMEIHTSLLGVLLQPIVTSEEFLPDAELSIIDWKTGETISVCNIATAGDTCFDT
jgi:hypothetical protein